jgi:hypothetical protein
MVSDPGVLDQLEDWFEFKVEGMFSSKYDEVSEILVNLELLIRLSSKSVARNGLNGVDDIGPGLDMQWRDRLEDGHGDLLGVAENHPDDEYS